MEGNQTVKLFQPEWLFTVLCFGLKCKEREDVQTHCSCLIAWQFKFPCATADASQGQFEVIHSSDLAEALTAGLVETSLEDMRHPITISDWHLLGSLKIPCGQTSNPFILFAIFPDTIKIPQNDLENLPFEPSPTVWQLKTDSQQLNILSWQISVEKKMHRNWVCWTIPEQFLGKPTDNRQTSQAVLLSDPDVWECKTKMLAGLLVVSLSQTSVITKKCRFFLLDWLQFTLLQHSPIHTHSYSATWSSSVTSYTHAPKANWGSASCSRTTCELQGLEI